MHGHIAISSEVLVWARFASEKAKQFKEIGYGDDTIFVVITCVGAIAIHVRGKGVEVTCLGIRATQYVEVVTREGHSHRSFNTFSVFNCSLGQYIERAL